MAWCRLSSALLGIGSGFLALSISRSVVGRVSSSSDSSSDLSSLLQLSSSLEEEEEEEETDLSSSRSRLSSCCSDGSMTGFCGSVVGSCATFANCFLCLGQRPGPWIARFPFWFTQSNGQGSWSTVRRTTPISLTASDALEVWARFLVSMLCFELHSRRRVTRNEFMKCLALSNEALHSWEFGLSDCVPPASTSPPQDHQGAGMTQEISIGIVQYECLMKGRNDDINGLWWSLNECHLRTFFVWHIGDKFNLNLGYYGY